MRIFGEPAAIHRIDREPFQSFLLEKVEAAIARTFGLKPRSGHCLGGMPSRRGVCALPWPESGRPADFRRVRTIFCVIVVLMLCFAHPSVASVARRSSNGPMAFGQWTSYIAEASQRFGVPAQWIRAVMQVESRGEKSAVSPKGAMGLMQVMAETYAELRLRYRLGDDPFAPRNNILAGAAYLREMRDRYGPGGFLAAYNAGPGRYEDYLKRGRPLPEETRNYVAALAPMIGVPGIPHQPGSASMAFQTATSRAGHITRTQSHASNKSRFGSEISQFDDRHSAQAMTLFAIIRAAFEPASANARTIDMTALEPAPGRALSVSSSAAERSLHRTSKAPRSSLAPRGEALFVGRSTLINN